MKNLPLLASLAGFAVSAIVFVVSVVQLFRMRFDTQSHRRRRHRSRLSKLRAHLFANESLRYPHPRRSRVGQRATASH
jgi:hypothetical protein